MSVSDGTRRLPVDVRVLENVDAVASYWDADLRLIWGNAAFRRLTASRGAIEGKKRDESLPDPEYAEYARLMREALTTGEERSIETAVDMRPLEGPDAPPRYFHGRYLPIREDGAVVGVLSFGVEVTGRVRAEKETSDVQNHLEQLVQALPAVLWQCDRGDARFTYVSDHAHRLLGFPAADWLQPGFLAARLHSDDHWVAPFRQREIEAGRGFDVSYRLINQGGNVVNVHEVVAAAATGNHRMRGLILDVTVEKQAETTRLLVETKLLQVQRLESMGLLASGVAHDFNNLLTAILGNASVALTQLPMSHPIRRPLDSVLAAAQRAADLTHQLLAYTGRGDRKIQLIDLNAHIRQLVDVLAAVVPKHVQLRVDLGENTPGVRADPGQLQQVLMNVVINGAEAIGQERGTVLISTARQVLHDEHVGKLFPKDGITPGVYACVEVHDTGCGMTQADAEKIFDPFYSTKAQGRGLGLAAVLGIVKDHGGALRVYSSLGRGTTFKILFPAVDAPQTLAEHTLPVSAGSGLVLVVDDEEHVRSTAALMLEHLGYDVAVAKDGKSGIEAYRDLAHKGALAFVLLDVSMPDLSGGEVFREMRAIRADIPVILSSGYNEILATRRFSGKGFATFVQKPYGIEQLIAALERAKAWKPQDIVL